MFVVVYFAIVENEGKINHCVQVLPEDSRVSPLYNPEAFTPVELNRIVRGQIASGRQVHILIQCSQGVLEQVIDYGQVSLSDADLNTSTSIAAGLMKTSDGFFFEIN